VVEFKDEIAERGLLSLFLNFPESYIEVSDVLRADDFATTTNRYILNCFVELVDENEDNWNGVDGITIRQKALDLGYKNFDKLTNDGDYVDTLIDHKVSKKNLMSLTKRIKDLSIKRRLRQASADINCIVLDPDKTSMDMLGSIETTVQDTINSLERKSKVEKLGSGFLEWVNAKADEPCALQGISTHLPRYDNMIGGGLRPGSVNLIAARPKNFKSGTGLNIAKGISVVDNIPVLLMDTELTKEYQMARLGASVSGVPINLLENGKWRNRREVVDSVEQGAKQIDDAPLYHQYIGGWGINEILSTMRHWLVKIVGRGPDGEFNPCVIIFDYLKLMSPKDVKNSPEWQVLGFQMTALHDFVTKYQVPMLLFAQLNREGGIAAADRLIWFCSSFSTLAHKSREEIETDGPAAGNLKLTTILTRFGPGMDEGDYLNLRVNFPCMQLEEWKFKSELSPDGPGTVEINGPND
jgi:replicative DNA helicase